MKVACVYAASIILFVWAVLLQLGLETRGVTVAGRILLGLTLGVHIHQELHDHRAR